jgi:excisionase family DNA binding protein
MKYQYLTIKETAALLRVSTRTVWRYIARGILESSQYCPHGLVRIQRDDIEKLLKWGQK